jgi:hypothetical protein
MKANAGLVPANKSRPPLSKTLAIILLPVDAYYSRYTYTVQEYTSYGIANLCFFTIL